MSSMNKVILIGHLGKDPETRYMPDGGAVTNFSMATSERWTDKKTGEQQEKTEWHRLSAFGRVAEIAGEYLKKGSLVAIEGKLQTRKWTDKDGVEKYTTEIIVDRLQMLDKRGSRDDGDAPQRPARPAGQPKPAAKNAGKFDDFEDDLPF